MKNTKRALTSAAALALSLTLLAGCGPEGSASGSASVSGSASGSSSMEQVPPAPGESQSRGMGRQFADLVHLYMNECDIAASPFDNAVVRSGNDQEIGPHLKQTYTVTSSVTLVVYTDQEDQHLLRVTVQIPNVPSEHELTVSRCVMGFVPMFFDANDSGTLLEQLHLDDAGQGASYTAQAASGSYIFSKTDKGSVLDYFAAVH